MPPSNANWIAASLPLYASIPSVLIFLALLGFLVSKPVSPATRYVLFAIWLRYVFSAFPVVTIARSPVGLTWNAIASLLVILLGLFILRRNVVLDKKYWPIIAFIVLGTLSGIANNDISTGIDEILKYLYLLFISCGLVQASRDIGFTRLLDNILWLFLIPCGLQAETLLLGVAKASESDGSRSYIGGYGHESAFSIVVLTGLFIVSAHPKMSLTKRLILIVLFMISILLANYRTAILAAGPLLFVTILTDVSGKFAVSQRKLVIYAMGATISLASLLVIPLVADRYDTLRVALSEGTNLIKPVNTFTVAERGVLSGRPYLWSEYYYGWKDSTSVQHYIGSGLGAWENVMPIYAHNTLVSTLYELGIFGFFSMLMIWASMLSVAMRIRAAIKPKLVAAHIGFIVLNMATMPFWQVEGLVLYGLICGSTLFWYQTKENKLVAPRQQHLAQYS